MATPPWCPSNPSSPTARGTLSKPLESGTLLLKDLQYLPLAQVPRSDSFFSVWFLFCPSHCHPDYQAHLSLSLPISPHPPAPSLCPSTFPAPTPLYSTLRSAARSPSCEKPSCQAGLYPSPCPNTCLGKQQSPQAPGSGLL